MLAQRGLMANSTCMARATGHAPLPKNRIARRDRAPLDVMLDSTDIHYASDTLVPQDDWRGRAGIPASPHVHVRPTDAGRLYVDEHLPGSKARDLDLSSDQGTTERLKHESSCLDGSASNLPALGVPSRTRRVPRRVSSLKG